MRDTNGLYDFARILMGIYFKCLVGMKVEGTENLPENGGFLIIANHRCAADPIALSISYRHGMVHFLAKSQLFAFKPLSALLKKVGAIPINRGESDLAAIRTAIQLLKDGKVLGIFPEGTRSRTGKLGELKTGSALIALRCGVPVIPVVLTGRYYPFGHLRLRIGTPIEASDLLAVRADNETLKAYTDRMTEALTQS